MKNSILSFACFVVLMTSLSSYSFAQVNDTLKITLGSNDKMQFDQTELTATEGQIIELTLVHNGTLPLSVMGHNFVLINNGISVADYAKAAMAEQENEYVVQDERFTLAATKLLGGGEQDKIIFPAPKSGTYDYLCSFPGHYAIMKGKLLVRSADGTIAEKGEVETAPIALPGNTTFYISLKEAHNMIGMLTLFVLLVVTVYILAQLIIKRPFDKLQQMFALFGLIITHTQLLLGFILYFLSPLGVSNFSGEAMGHSISRFYIVEHPVGMILAAVLITIGYRASKKDQFSDKKKYKRVLILYGIGLALIAKMVPWFLWN